MKNVILLGFMGTGKSCVAKAVAEMLGRTVVSVDKEIERREGAAISDIFSAKGEPYFREAEKAVIKDLSRREGIVIDAGGGAVLDGENLDSLRGNGLLICLNAKPETILNRVSGNSDRPLLDVPDPLAKVSELLAKRAPYYASVENQIDTEGKSVSEVAGEVTTLYNDKAGAL